MKIIHESDTNIKFEVKTSLGYTHFEIHPSMLASTFTAEPHKYRAEYRILHRYYFGGEWRVDQFYIDAEEYSNVLSFLTAHNVRPWSQDFEGDVKPVTHKIINPIMELEV